MSDQPTLPGFLQARIAEDWAAIDVRAGVGVDYWTDAEREACERVGRTRMLAECEAKRRIVEYCPAASEDGDAWDTAFWRVLQMLALPYADHPDYREEWRP